MGSYTGTVPTFLAGEVLDADKLAEVSLFMTAETAAWSTYTPTLTSSAGSPAVGNGTINGYYRLIGKTCEVIIILTRGSTTSFGTGYISFSLPSVTGARAGQPGKATLTDFGTNTFAAGCFLETTTKITPVSTSGVINSTTPFTWATSDVLALHIQFETT